MKLKKVLVFTLTYIVIFNIYTSSIVVASKIQTQPHTQQSNRIIQNSQNKKPKHSNPLSLEKTKKLIKNLENLKGKKSTNDLATATANIQKEINKKRALLKAQLKEIDKLDEDLHKFKFKLADKKQTAQNFLEIISKDGKISSLSHSDVGLLLNEAYDNALNKFIENTYQNQSFIPKQDSISNLFNQMPDYLLERNASEPLHNKIKTITGINFPTRDVNNNLQLEHYNLEDFVSTIAESSSSHNTEELSDESSSDSVSQGNSPQRIPVIQMNLNDRTTNQNPMAPIDPSSIGNVANNNNLNNINNTNIGIIDVNMQNIVNTGIPQMAPNINPTQNNPMMLPGSKKEFPPLQPR